MTALTIFNPFTKEDLMHLASLAITNGVSPEELQKYLDIIRSESPNDTTVVDMEGESEGITLKNGFLSVNGRKTAVPRYAAEIIKALNEGPGTAMTQPDLAAATDLAETSIYPGVSKIREFLKDLHLPAHQVLVTIKAGKGSGDKASYMWSDDYPVTVE